MSDDLNKKLKQITDILGQENIPDNVKGLLSLLTGTPGDREEAPPQKASEPPVTKETRSERTELDESMEMVRKVKKVMERLGNNNDPRINLLTAVRPFLNSKRQKRLNSCIRMLQMTSLARVMDDEDKGIF